MRLRTLCGLILSSTLLFAGCSDLRQPAGGDGTAKPQSSGKRYIEVLAEANANQQRATYLDVIFIYKQEVVDHLPASAERWFMLREELQRIAGQHIEVISYEVPPSFAVGSLELPPRADKALKVVAFASYGTAAGQAMIDLTQQRQVELRLGPQAVVLNPR